MRNAVVILEPDQRCAETLAARLRIRFRRVLTAHSLEELRQTASRLAVDVAILDLALVPISEIRSLCAQLRTEIVCTHHLADEDMWIQALEAGALDCCYDDDCESIVRAVASAAGADRPHRQDCWTQRSGA